MRKWIWLILGGVSVGSLGVLGDGINFWFVVDKFTRSAIHFLTRDSSKEVDFQEPTNASRTRVLIEEINRLSKEVTKTLSFLEERPRRVFYSESGFTYSTLVNAKTMYLLFGAIIGSFILKKAFGFRLLGFWYVTRSCFVATTEKWLNSINCLSIKMKQFYEDLNNHTLRIGNRVKENQKDIQQRLETDTKQYKHDISIITGDLLGVREHLCKINLVLDNIHGSLALTNKGVEMLCHFVLQRTLNNTTEDTFMNPTVSRELTDMTNCLSWQTDEKKRSIPHDGFSSMQKRGQANEK